MITEPDRSPSGAAFAGVLLDRRGTVVVAPTHPSLVATALQRLDREASPTAVQAVLGRLGAVDSSEVESDVRLGLTADEVLVVGDRSTHDGAACGVGVTALLLPPLRSVEDVRLHRVLDLVLPGARGGHHAPPPPAVSS